MIDDLSPASLFSLTGKVAFVTGAAQGIGNTLARALSAAGATLVLADRNADVEQKAKELRDLGYNAHAMVLDVTDAAAVKNAIQSTVARFDGLDILVNNAAILMRRPFLELQLQEWQSVIDVNLTACFVVAQEAARVMSGRGGGRIINMASIVAHTAKPRMTAYIAAKGAIAAFTRALAAELAGTGITANAIAPGYTATSMSQSGMDAAYIERIKATVPAGRWGSPEDLCGVVQLLASRAGSYINGQVIYVDGGFTAVSK